MRRALGKGLSQLLQDQEPAPPPQASSSPRQPASSGLLPVGSIQANSRQPRQQFDDEGLEELAASIKEFGILQPLLVREVGEGRYELIAGERRLRASKLAGLKEVPVIVKTATAQASLEIALIENIQREDITAIECAVAYRSLMEEFGLNQDQVANKVGKSRVAISNTIRLLRLPQTVQDAILGGSLTEGHARALLMVESPLRQDALFEKILSEGISVRETERLARSGGGRTPSSGEAKAAPVARDPNFRALEQKLSEFFGSPCRIAKSGAGGSVSVDFYSDEDLQRILDVLGVGL